MTEGQDTSLAGTPEISGQKMGEQSITGQESANPTAIAGNGEEQNFMLNYADKDAAIRGHKESQAKITELSNKVKAFESSVQTDGRLEALETMQLQANKDRSYAGDLERQRVADKGLEDMRQRIADDPGETVNILNDQVYRNNQALAAQKEELTNAFQEQLAKLQSGMDTKFFESSSEYQTYSEEIGQLKSNSALSNLSGEQLLAMAKTMNPDKVVNMAGSVPMGGGGGNTYSPAAPIVEKYDEWMKDELRQYGYTEEKIQESEARFIAKQGK